MGVNVFLRNLMRFLQKTGYFHPHYTTFSLLALRLRVFKSQSLKETVFAVRDVQSAVQEDLSLITQTMFTPYRKAFAPARKPYRIGLPFTHKNGDLSEISVREPVAPRRSLKWRVTYRIGVHTIPCRHVCTKSYCIYSNKCPTSNQRPPRISAHPKGRKS